MTSHSQPFSIRFILFSLLGLIFFCILCLTLWLSYTTQKQRTDELAQEQVALMAKSYFDSINTMMLTGTIANREIARTRMMDERTLDIRTIRSEQLNKMFGSGLETEKPQDDWDRAALLGQTQIHMHSRNGERVLTYIKPLQATDDYQGANCNTCHASKTGDVLGAVRVDFSMKSLDSSMFASLIQKSIWMILIFIMGFVLTGFLLRQLVLVRLQNMRETMQGISLNSDLTLQLEDDREDEIGQVSAAFNLMVQQLHESLKAVLLLVNNLNQSVSTINEMAAKTDQDMANQKSNTDMVAAAVNELATSATDIDDHATEAFKETGSTLDYVRQSNVKAHNAAEDIRALNEKVHMGRDIIQALTQKSHDVGRVLEIISGVADQTNLLALNAAIEAARAGEQGRGFAVVADEVRALAFKTQQSTEEIRNTVEGLQGQAEQSEAVMTDVSDLATKDLEEMMNICDELDNISDAVAKVTELNTHMQSAANEQNKVTDDINDSIVQIHDIASIASENAALTASISKDLSTLAKELENTVSKFKLSE